MAKPRGYPKSGTGFWDTHPREQTHARTLLYTGLWTYQEIIAQLKKEFGDLSGFNMCQMSRLKQKLKVTKKG